MMRARAAVQGVALIVLGYVGALALGGIWRVFAWAAGL